ncbi:hypothetical protein OBBRIDRAFT_884782 [Obba rivulosa]|uniref:Uncharacterized protein n=1 Tax=Obba rivulosa TaxID=1052685 RepID=A0A8E2DRK2_9APHY|nr:hypothetical protein OBBRIDRAFT_884782 [Obba rivulosa]
MLDAAPQTNAFNPIATNDPTSSTSLQTPSPSSVGSASSSAPACSPSPPSSSFSIMFSFNGIPSTSATSSATSSAADDSSPAKFNRALAAAAPASSDPGSSVDLITFTRNTWIIIDLLVVWSLFSSPFSSGCV